MDKRLFITLIICICASYVISGSSVDHLEEDQAKHETTSSNESTESVQENTSTEETDLPTRVSEANTERSTTPAAQTEGTSEKANEINSYHPGYVSTLRDNCPRLSPTCPDCFTDPNELPSKICNYPVVLKVLLLSSPQIDSIGRICGKFGMLSTHRGTDQRQFRRLLRFSVKESCGCKLKASQHYYLMSHHSALLKQGHLYHKISLSEETLLVSVDWYSEAEILNRLKSCSATNHSTPITPEEEEEKIQPRMSSKIDPPARPKPVPPPPRNYQQPPPSPKIQYQPIPNPPPPPHISIPSQPGLHDRPESYQTHPTDHLYYSPDAGTPSPENAPRPPPYNIPVPQYRPSLPYTHPPYSPPIYTQPPPPPYARPTYAPPPQPTYAPPQYPQPTYAPVPYAPPSLHHVPSAQQYGLHLYAHPFVPVLNNCVRPQSCPPVCEPIDGKVDFAKAYCVADYALVSAVIFPDRSLINRGNMESPYSTGTCLELRTKIVFDVSKGSDPKRLNIDLPLLLPSNCNCFSHLKGPLIVVILVFYEPFPSSSPYQLTVNHDLFLLPAPSTITFPNCVPPPMLQPYAPTPYPQASVMYKPVVVTSTPVIVNEPAATCEDCYSGSSHEPDAPCDDCHSGSSQPYTASRCPYGIQDSCPECSRALEDWLIPLFCSAQFAIVAELQKSGPYSVSYSFPSISVTLTKTYLAKKIVINISNPSRSQCTQGSLSVIHRISPPYNPYGPPPRSVIPFVAFSECSCPFLTLGTRDRLLVFSSELPTFLPNGALQLSKDIYIAPLAPYAPLPNCASPYNPPPPVYRPHPPPPVYQTPAPPVHTTPAPPVYTPAPVYKTPAPPVYTPAPVYKTPAPPVYTPPPVYETPAPPVKTSPQTPPYTPPPLYTHPPAYSTAAPVVYTNPPVYTAQSTPAYQTLAPPVHPPAYKPPAPYSLPIAHFPPPQLFEECPLVTKSCPSCATDLPPNFADYYCVSQYAVIVAIGLDYNVLQREKEDPRILPFIPAEPPHISLIYDNYQYMYNITVTRTKTMKRINNKYSYAGLCSKERVRGLYKVSKSYQPYEQFSDLDLYIPAECDCETLDLSPAFGILLSLSQPDYLNRPLQLTDKFAFFPFPHSKTALPDCNYQGPASQHPYSTLLSTVKYNAPNHVTQQKQVDCEEAPCIEDCSLNPPYQAIIPCDAKVAVLLEILESSAGSYVVPTLEILQYSYGPYAPTVWLNVKSNEPHHKQPGVYDENAPIYKNCKYLKVKVVQDLSSYPLLEKDTEFTITAGSNCNHNLFRKANGYALLITSTPVSQNDIIPLSSSILKCIPSGTTRITLCVPKNSQTPKPISTDIPYTPAPVTYGTPAPVTYAPPPVTYKPAPVTYAPPPVTYKPAPVTYAPPPVTYKPPPVTYAPPPVTYKPPPVTYAPPPPVTYAPPPVTYKPAPVTYAPPPVTYKPAPVTYAPPPVTYKPPPVTYAPPPATYKPPPVTYAPPPPVTYAPPPPVTYAPPPVTYASPPPATYAPPPPVTYAPPPVTYAPPPPVTYAPPPPVTYASPRPATYAPPPPVTYGTPAPKLYDTPAPKRYTTPPSIHYTPSPVTYGTPAPIPNTPTSVTPVPDTPSTKRYTTPAHLSTSTPAVSILPFPTSQPQIPPLNPPDCENHEDSSCPICVDSVFLTPEAYCNAKMTLVLKSTGKFIEDSSTCLSGMIYAVYDVTARKGPTKALLTVLVTIPKQCECKALEGNGFFVLLVKDDPPPLVNPLVFQFSSKMELYSMGKGQLTLPACKEANELTNPRSDSDEPIVMSLDPTELAAAFPRGPDLKKCPTMSHSCPKCLSLEDHVLQELVCSSDEVYKVTTEKKTKVSESPRKYEKLSLMQNIAENYTLDIKINPYKHEDICSLPLKKGKCNSSLTRYYYDPDVEVCSEFEFKECDGNANNFETETECEAACMNNDFCYDGSFNIQSIIKSYEEVDPTENFRYAVPEYCDCPQLQTEDEMTYLVYNISSKPFGETTQLTQDFYLIQLSDSQKEEEIVCGVTTAADSMEFEDFDFDATDSPKQEEDKKSSDSEESDSERTETQKSEEDNQSSNLDSTDSPNSENNDESEPKKNKWFKWR